MKITIAGLPGSGKSTIAKIVASKLKYKHYSTGDFMRELAHAKGLSLLEISKQAEKSHDIDKELDDRQKTLGQVEDNFVLDARLGWHFIPDSFKVFLKVDEQVAAQRIFNDKRPHEKENTSVDQTIENNKKRIQSEVERYKKYYDLNPLDDSNYDLILDTTDGDPDAVAQKIIKAVNL